MYKKLRGFTKFSHFFRKLTTNEKHTGGPHQGRTELANVSFAEKFLMDSLLLAKQSMESHAIALIKVTLKVLCGLVNIKKDSTLLNQLLPSKSPLAAFPDGSSRTPLQLLLNQRHGLFQRTTHRPGLEALHLWPRIRLHWKAHQPQS